MCIRTSPFLSIGSHHHNIGRTEQRAACPAAGLISTCKHVELCRGGSPAVLTNDCRRSGTPHDGLGRGRFQANGIGRSPRGQVHSTALSRACGCAEPCANEARSVAAQTARRRSAGQITGGNHDPRCGWRQTFHRAKAKSLALAQDAEKQAIQASTSESESGVQRS